MLGKLSDSFSEEHIVEFFDFPALSKILIEFFTLFLIIKQFYSIDSHRDRISEASSINSLHSALHQVPPP